MDIGKAYREMCNCPEIQRKWKESLGDYYWNDNVAKLACTNNDFKFVESYKKISIWLPRQDQIQEMLGKSESCFCIFQTEDGWGGEIIQDREHVFYVALGSPEHVWLAFYMWEKHGKTWNGDKWLKKR